MNILAIGADPDDTDDIEFYTDDTDDIEFYTDASGGLLLKAVEQGHNVFMYTLTTDEVTFTAEKHRTECVNLLDAQ